MSVYDKHVATNPHGTADTCGVSLNTCMYSFIYMIDK